MGTDHDRRLLLEGRIPGSPVWASRARNPPSHLVDHRAAFDFSFPGFSTNGGLRMVSIGGSRLSAFFQHPDTGEACGAVYEVRKKLLVVTTESGAVVLSSNAETVADACRELIQFGIPADEAVLEAI